MSDENTDANEETLDAADAGKELELGPQPLGKIMLDLELKTHDLVAASTEQITHKMVSKGCRGRRLSPTVKYKLLTALNKVTGKSYRIRDLFNY